MYSKLNENQRKAVLHKDGPMLVLAGPGSGKTMVITYRTYNLIKEENVKAENILVITFTKAAATEMKMRFDKLIKEDTKVTFGTFHAVFYRILRSFYNFNLNNILKEDVKKTVLRNIIRKLQIEFEDENEFVGDVIKEISLMKCELCKIEDYQPGFCSIEEFRTIVSMYEEYKSDNKLVDFDDMLTKCYELLSNNEEALSFWQNKYKYILIDEFQDINKAQYEIIRLLSKTNNNIFIVGDDDQSIYKFRGARPEFILNFTKEYEDAKKVVLNTNYRSTKSIVNFSNKLIKNNQNRYLKNMTTNNEQGIKPIIIEANDVVKESEMIANKIIEVINEYDKTYKDVAVIYRTNIQSRTLINTLFHMNIPFVVRDKVPIIYDHWIAKDVIAYMKLSQDVMDKEALVRIINKPKRYIRKADIQAAKAQVNMWTDLYERYTSKVWMIDKLEELQFKFQVMRNMTPFNMINFIRSNIGYEEYLMDYCEFRKINVTSLVEVLEELSESTKAFDTVQAWLEHIDVYRETMLNNAKQYYDEDRVTLTTMHSSKGLEFDFVWVASVVEGLIPHKRSDRDEEIEEERRLLYVGMTRAKEKLYISYVKNRFGKSAEESRFIKEIRQSYMDDVDEGKNIYHKKFGKGKIIDMNGDNVTALFPQKGEVKLNISFCLKQNIIKLDI